jgi:hypothetical protein
MVGNMLHFLRLDHQAPRDNSRVTAANMVMTPSIQHNMCHQNRVEVGRVI